MDPETRGRHHQRLTSGQDTRSARCGESRTPGAGGGPRETTGGDTGTAPAGLPHDRAAGGQVAIRGAGPSTGPIFRSHCPDLIRQELAAWIAGTELVRAAARQAARLAVPARKGRRAGQPAHPREISFTAARRAAIASIRTGAATASLPAAITAARRQATLRDLGRRRVTIDRDRHRDHKTKARQPFPAAGRGTATRKAPATITLCGPIAA